MGRVTMRPAVWLGLVTGGNPAPSTVPAALLPPGNPAPPRTWLPHVLSLHTAMTLATAKAGATFVVADPTGAIAATYVPNDLVTVVINSRRNQSFAGTAPPAGAQPCWSGLVDTCQAWYDARAPYGRAALIKASSMWKAFEVTDIPLTRFVSGQLPTGGLTTEQLLEMAIADIQANLGIGLTLQVASDRPAVTTAPWAYPNDWEDPQLQSWASYILASVAAAGQELYCDEAGAVILRGPRYTDAPALSLADEEIFAEQPGVTDDGLVTNVVVTFSQSPSLALAAASPSADLTQIGPLPPRLAKAARLGRRFEGRYAPWVSDLAGAQQYAASVREIGVAGAEFCQTEIALNGDIRIGTVVAHPGAGKRYYETTVEHDFEFGQDATTRLTERYGIDLAGQWQPAAGAAPISLPGFAPGYAPSVGGNNAFPNGLPALGADPSTGLTYPTLTVQDIQAYLTKRGAPYALVQQSALIWTQGQQSGIDPSFALAVWTVESNCGQSQIGSQDRNLGGQTAPALYQSAVDTASGGGPWAVFPDYGSAVKSWFALLHDYANRGLNTVGTVAPTYAPDSASAPTQAEDWARTVGGLMQSIRGAAQGAPMTADPTPPAGDGTQPAGYPVAAPYRSQVILGFGPTTASNEPPAPPVPGYPQSSHFHRGIDFGCPVGTSLFTPISGKLTVGGGGILPDVFDSATGYGLCAYIQNGPWIVKLAHCSALAPGIQNGQYVTAGQTVMLSGKTGNWGSISHVHFEIDMHDLIHPIDPSKYL